MVASAKTNELNKTNIEIRLVYTTHQPITKRYWVLMCCVWILKRIGIGIGVSYAGIHLHSEVSNSSFIVVRCVSPLSMGQSSWCTFWKYISYLEYLWAMYELMPSLGTFINCFKEFQIYYLIQPNKPEHQNMCWLCVVRALSAFRSKYTALGYTTVCTVLRYLNTFEYWWLLQSKFVDTTLCK